MNYKIFQICFEPRQIELVQSPLTPFDNTANERPELREYHSFSKAYDTGAVDGLDAWGFFGPRWEGKLKYSAEDIKRTIDENQNQDVWIFNHARVVNSLTYNVWEQGEYYHKGLKQVAKAALEIAGHSTDALNAFMTEHNTGYCSYFVARKKFWDEYFHFLIGIKDALEQLPDDIKSIYESSANYARDKNLNMFPFIVERMFSTFLVMNRDKFRIYNKPYNYEVYRNQVGDFVDTLAALNRMKTDVVTRDSADAFDNWHAIRMYFVKMHPELFNLD